MYIKSIWDRVIGCEKNRSYVPNNLNIFYPVHMQISLILRKQLSFHSLLTECTHLLHLLFSFKTK